MAVLQADVSEIKVSIGEGEAGEPIRDAGLDAADGAHATDSH